MTNPNRTETARLHLARIRQLLAGVPDPEPRRAALAAEIEQAQTPPTDPATAERLAAILRGEEP